MTIVAVPAILDLGTVPNNNMDESTFNSASESFTSNMPPWAGDLAAVAGSAKTNAEHAHAKAGESATSAQTAADRLVDVQAAANGAFASANYKGEWSSLAGALNLPATVTHQGRLWYLKSNLANVAAQQPGLGSVYWGEVSRNDYIVFNAPAGNTLAVDRGFYRMSTSTSTLVLPAAPFHGMVVAAVNVSSVLSLLISRNGKTICGDAEDYRMNMLGAQVVLMYDANSGDWIRVNGITAEAPYKEAVLQQKTITVTAPATTGIASAAHGISRSQIKGISVSAYGASFTVGPEYSSDTLSFSAYLDDTNCNVSIVAGKGSAIYGRPVSFTIFYGV